MFRARPAPKQARRVRTRNHRFEVEGGGEKTRLSSSMDTAQGPIRTARPTMIRTVLRGVEEDSNRARTARRVCSEGYEGARSDATRERSS